MRCCTSQPYRVIIKDNGSQDGTIEYIEKCNNVDKLIISQNNDYANVEYRTYDNIINNNVKTPYFLVCHSDIVFLRSDWVEEITESLHTDPYVVMWGQIQPSIHQSGTNQVGRIMGRWLSPWYAWGKTLEFRELNFTWQRKFCDWCEINRDKLTAYFDQDLMNSHPQAKLFWEHGGYLLYLIDKERCKVLNYKSRKIQHLGDMTGSVVKKRMFPHAIDPVQRHTRVFRINELIHQVNEATQKSDVAFMSGCQDIATYAQQNSFGMINGHNNILKPSQAFP
jgi:hypothetical protein